MRKVTNSHSRSTSFPDMLISALLDPPIEFPVGINSCPEPSTSSVESILNMVVLFSVVCVASSVLTAVVGLSVIVASVVISTVDDSVVLRISELAAISAVVVRFSRGSSWSASVLLKLECASEVLECASEVLGCVA